MSGVAGKGRGVGWERLAVVSEPGPAFSIFTGPRFVLSG